MVGVDLAMDWAGGGMRAGSGYSEHATSASQPPTTAGSLHSSQSGLRLLALLLLYWYKSTDTLLLLYWYKSTDTAAASVSSRRQDASLLALLVLY